jgi:hypothetical protein
MGLGPQVGLIIINDVNVNLISPRFFNLSKKLNATVMYRIDTGDISNKELSFEENKIKILKEISQRLNKEYGTNSNLKNVSGKFVTLGIKIGESEGEMSIYFYDMPRALLKEQDLYLRQELENLDFQEDLSPNDYELILSGIEVEIKLNLKGKFKNPNGPLMALIDIGDVIKDSLSKIGLNSTDWVYLNSSFKKNNIPKDLIKVGEWYVFPSAKKHIIAGVIS